MTTTIKATEDIADEIIPDALYTVMNLSPAAAALSKAAIWQRIESYIAYRWTERDVTWIVEGPGEWHPPLTPATIATVEIWDGEAWEVLEPTPSPLGYWLPGCGPYRFTATVGGGSPDPEVPAVVLEGFRRLAEHMAAKMGEAGARSYSVTIESLSESFSRDEAWIARAMQNSGAADLLRPYRRAQ
jgi:hypothetical protein